MSTGQRRERITGQERRAVIFRAAGLLFARDGYAATKLDDIAAAAHVTKPIIYRHFDSKKALYLALLAKHREDLPSFVQRVSDKLEDRPPENLLRAILEHWLDYVRENQHAWVMLFRDSSGDWEIQDFRRQTSLRAREVLAAFVTEQAGARIPSEQVEPTAELLRSGLAGLALWWIDHPDTPKDVLVEVVVRFGEPAASG
jgi:AcrR family transcriptional regulator